MNRKIIISILVGLSLISTSLAPGARAQVETTVTVTVLEGVGKVCNNVPGGECAYYMDDPLWNRVTNNPPGQGLYWPGVGPAARYSPVEFTAGPQSLPPGSLCVSTVTGPGCSIRSFATPEEARAMTHGVFRGRSGVGAYCGSSYGRLTSTFTAAPHPVTGQTYPQVTFDYTWEQSAATILPIVGRGNDGSTLIGFTSSRGVSGSGDCGISAPTTAFQVEGFTVSFRAP
ncbi:MAG TPA: hypothetical protein VM840_01785 [Actinomycetota bacterium]|nr:hypothetical protein [Actinomycetota bacterium]